MKSQPIYKHQFQKLLFFFTLLCFSIFSGNLKAQATVENINLPYNTGTAMVLDILLANGHIYTYTPNGINVYDASNNTFEINFPFGEKYGKFNPVFFNSLLHVPDQNLMVFNNEGSNPYVYIMMPDMNIMVINTSNFQQVPWQTELVVGVGNNEKSLHSLFLTQNRRCMMKYDDLNNRLYILAGGRDRTYNTNCHGYFHVRTNVMSIFELDYNVDPDQARHFNRIYSETNGEGVGAYGLQVNNFTFNSATDEFILARIGGNPINNDSYSIINKYEITTSGVNPTDTLTWVVPGSTGYHKIGKLLNISDNSTNLSRIAIFPYKFPSGDVPNPEFLLLNWDLTSIEAIPCPTDKVIDAVYLEGKDELLLSYSPDDNSSNNLARYHFDATTSPSFTLIEQRNEDESPVSSNFDYNTVFEFVKLDATSTLLGKKDGIAKLHYDASDSLLYSTPHQKEGNIFRKGVAVSAIKAFLINGASNELEIFNNGGFSSIRTSYPTCRNIRFTPWNRTPRNRPGRKPAGV